MQLGKPDPVVPSCDRFGSSFGNLSMPYSIRHACLKYNLFPHADYRQCDNEMSPLLLAKCPAIDRQPGQRYISH